MTLNKLIEEIRKRNYSLVTCESATCGLIANTLGQISGVSSIYKCGFVVYSAFAKNKITKIPKKIIEKYGTVSYEVAKRMVVNSCKICKCECGISVTGVAGPSEVENKKVGLFFIGIKVKEKLVVEEVFIDKKMSRIEYQNKIMKICFYMLSKNLNS